MNGRCALYTCTIVHILQHPRTPCSNITIGLGFRARVMVRVRVTIQSIDGIGCHCKTLRYVHMLHYNAYHTIYLQCSMCVYVGMCVTVCVCVCKDGCIYIISVCQK